MKKVLVFTFTMILAGCSNPKDATELNFKKSIQDYLNIDRACMTVNGDFPYDFETEKGRNSILDELVKIGMLTSEDLVVSRQTGMNLFTGEKIFKEKNVIRYSLTQKGNEVSELVSKGLRTLMGSVTGQTKFCYGKYEVVNILGFSEPVDFMGQKVSKVKYTYKISNIAEWANNALFKSNSHKLKRDLDPASEPENSKATLMLTNNGWVHQKLFK